MWLHPIEQFLLLEHHVEFAITQRSQPLTQKMNWCRMCEIGIKTHEACWIDILWCIFLVADSCIQNAKCDKLLLKPKVHYRVYRVNITNYSSCFEVKLQLQMKGTEVPNPQRSSACDCTCVLTRNRSLSCDSLILAMRIVCKVYSEVSLTQGLLVYSGRHGIVE